MELKTKTLFAPVKRHVWKPNTVYTEHMLPSGRHYINLWHFNNYPGAPVLLFCHGNSGNISHRDYMVEFADLAKINLILFDYVGYGKSIGVPSLSQIERDGLTAYDFAAKYYPPDKIICWGESLGSFVATTIASNRNCGYLLLLATFSSFDHIISNKDYPKWLKVFLATSIYYLSEVEPSHEKIKRVECPILIMHSDEDELIPHKCARILYDCAGGTKRYVSLLGGHASPVITLDQLQQVYEYVGIPFDQTRSQDYQLWLTKLSNLVDYHGRDYWMD